MVQSVEISNFKAIESASFQLGQFNVFVGSNNSGKSSVLQAIQFAVGTAQTARRMARYLDHKTITFSASAESFSYLPIKDVEALVHNRNLTQTQGSLIAFSDGVNRTEISIKRGKNRNISTTMVNSPLLVQLMSSQPYCVITPGVSGISISEEFKAKATVLKSATRGDSNFYLRNILLLLKKQGAAWMEFIEKLHLFFPGYNLEVKFDEEDDDTIEVQAKLSGGITLPIDALGTSILQILQILSYIYFFDPQMLILDEPDTHLHPNNQRKLISVLSDISLEKNMQVLLSTHSRHMIDEATSLARFFWMQNGAIHKTILETDSSDLVEMILDLGALDKNDFLTNPKIKWIVCTEDARANKEAMLKAILASSGYNVEECAILPYKGCSKIESAVLLHDFIKQYAPNAQMIIHRDRDYLPDEQIDSLLEKIQSNGIRFWATPGTDVEALFVNAAHIKYLYPGIDLDVLENIVTDSIAETREKSISKFVNYISNNTNERDYRKINLDCEKWYDQMTYRFFYGKTALGLIKGKVQALLSKNPQFFQPSPYLAQQQLHDLLSE